MNKSREAFRTISEVSDWLETPAHVLRFWESKFSQIRPVKGAGGRRYYRPEDMALLGGIKFLLHEQGLTIKGAQKLLREQGVRYVASLGPQLFADDDAPAPVPVAAVIAPTYVPEVEVVATASMPEVEVFDPAIIDAPAIDAPFADTPVTEIFDGDIGVTVATGEVNADRAQASPIFADVPAQSWQTEALPSDALPDPLIETAAPTPIATAILSGHVHAAPGIAPRLAALAERAEAMRSHAVTKDENISSNEDEIESASDSQTADADQIFAESAPAESQEPQVTPRRTLHQMLIHLMLSAPVQQAQDRETLAALKLRLHDARARISIE